MNTATTPKYTHLTIAHDGKTWTFHQPGYTTESGTTYGPSTLTGYGEDYWRYAHQAEPDAVVLDWRTATREQAIHAAVSGPMCDDRTPAGTISRLWQEPRAINEEDEFYGAGPMDTLHSTDYIRMIQRHGITVTTLDALT